MCTNKIIHQTWKWFDFEHRSPVREGVSKFGTYRVPRRDCAFKFISGPPCWSMRVLPSTEGARARFVNQNTKRGAGGGRTTTTKRIQFASLSSKWNEISYEWTKRRKQTNGLDVSSPLGPLGALVVVPIFTAVCIPITLLFFSGPHAQTKRSVPVDHSRRDAMIGAANTTNKHSFKVKFQLDLLVLGKQQIDTSDTRSDCRD